MFYPSLYYLFKLFQRWVIVISLQFIENLRYVLIYVYDEESSECILTTQNIFQKNNNKQLYE